ncbi:unnamed protein product [Cyprideis torosa]|uniref:Uncharacterized protein n=1 Tax=Cyprideis torosa TaxID=163714 RepID=A0A7R8W4E7_9CRUS|nr:unnamed protein product [Cyprideis torosa]CAG0879497.1 unnamed protein product [Cyprideis torosa]
MSAQDTQTPSIKDAPKVDPTLKNELATFDASKNLHHTETEEKNPLPTKEVKWSTERFFVRFNQIIQVIHLKIHLSEKVMVVLEPNPPTPPHERLHSVSVMKRKRSGQWIKSAVNPVDRRPVLLRYVYKTSASTSIFPGRSLMKEWAAVYVPKRVNVIPAEQCSVDKRLFLIHVQQEKQHEHLLDDVVHFDRRGSLKTVETIEKIRLPTAEDLKEERQHSSVLHLIQMFNKKESLKHTHVKEKNPLPTAEDLESERQHSEILAKVATFDRRGSLKHAEPVEKVHLPTKEELEEERQHSQLLSSVAKFDRRSSLKRIGEVREKVALPSASDVLKEKTEQAVLKEVEEFKKDQLKHAETEEKTVLPGAEEIQLEKGQQELRAGIEHFDSSKLKHAETVEKNPLPTKEDLEAAKKGA